MQLRDPLDLCLGNPLLKSIVWLCTAFSVFRVLGSRGATFVSYGLVEVGKTGTGSLYSLVRSEKACFIR